MLKVSAVPQIISKKTYPVLENGLIQILQLYFNYLGEPGHRITTLSFFLRPFTFLGEVVNEGGSFCFHTVFF